MIKGRCETNLDNCQVDRVELFARVPNIGERVAVTRDYRADTLMVVQVTHDVKDEEPFIIVELND